MICPYCGQENPEDVEVCGFCGGSLIETTTQPAMESRAAEPVVEVIQTPAEPQEAKMLPLSVPPVPSKGIYGNRVWWIVGCVVLILLVIACIALANGLYRLIKPLGLLNPTAVTEISPSGIEATVSYPAPLSNLETTTAVIPPDLSAQQTITTGGEVLPTPELLYFDDFSDPKTGWDEVEETDYSTSYFEGAYRIRVNAEMTDSWANPAELVFDDVRIEVDATKNGGPDDNDFGVICRYLDLNRFYYAMISSDGYYGISKASVDSTNLLGRENLDYSDLINQGPATNHIRFDCVGDTLTLYVNGQLLDQQSDGEYLSGNIGLIAGTFGTPGTDILFDNFSIYSP